jgi:dTDP-4-amino-4,6-dideoxygalactose transaminase
VDIDPGSFTLDPSRIEEALTTRTKAIVPVHLYGQAAPIEGDSASSPIGAGFYEIEDAAQAHGAAHGGPAGGIVGCHMACFRFYPTIEHGARCGDGGGVHRHAADPDLCRMRRVVCFANTVWAERYVSRHLRLETRAWTSCRRRFCGLKLR